MPAARRGLTIVVPLLGGQDRLKQLILHVAKTCEGARYFGAIKLNKIIWKADFDSFAERQLPVTGREYRRQKFGPALREMRPLQSDMIRDGLIRFEPRDFGDGIVEQRTIALVEPNLTKFSPTDLTYVDRSIQHYWSKTGTESSDESHGVAWLTRANGDPMPYESSLLSDRTPPPSQLERLKQKIRSRMHVSE